MAIRPDRMMLDEGTVFTPQKTSKPIAAKGQPVVDVFKGSTEVLPTKVPTVETTTATTNINPVINTPRESTTTTTTTQSESNTIQQNSADRQSAFDILYEKFGRLGLTGLVAPLQSLIKNENIKSTQFTTELRNSDAYKKRFAANAQRLARGMTPLDEATYIENEMQYEKIMKNYGLPSQYYAGWTDPTSGVTYKPSFEKLLSGDVSPIELEDRIITGKQVMNASAPMIQAIKDWYPDITDGEILTYVLDPQNAIKEIQRKVSLGALGGEAIARGLSTSQKRAEELYNYGVTAEKYRSAAPFISEASVRGGQLGSFYQTPYEQAMAESEAFGLAGATEAEQKRKKLTNLEQASFAGSSGVAQNAITRDRAAGLI